jgi:hypothetical protein
VQEGESLRTWGANAGASAVHQWRELPTRFSSSKLVNDVEVVLMQALSQQLLWITPIVNQEVWLPATSPRPAAQAHLPGSSQEVWLTATEPWQTAQQACPATCPERVSSLEPVSETSQQGRTPTQHSVLDLG